MKSGYYWVKIKNNITPEIAHYEEYSQQMLEEYKSDHPGYNDLGEFIRVGNSDCYSLKEVTVLSGSIESGEIKPENLDIDHEI